MKPTRLHYEVRTRHALVEPALFVLSRLLYTQPAAETTGDSGAVPAAVQGYNSCLSHQFCLAAESAPSNVSTQAQARDPRETYHGRKSPRLNALPTRLWVMGAIGLCRIRCNIAV
ncbi:unnamed protein product [Ectocarpus sp. 13 AM-2016]